MPYRLTVMMHFSDQADAQDAYDQMEARANLSGLVTDAGGEATSYARLKDQSDGSVVEQWYKDRFGIIRAGEYEAPSGPHPQWVDPGGDATKAYPATDAFGEDTRVVHNGTIWLNVHGSGNVWEPGVVNETIWQDEGAV